MRNDRRSRFRLSVAALALGALAIAPAQAATSPFSVKDALPDCSDYVNGGGGTVCDYEMGTAPAGKRWDLHMIACRNNLLSTTAGEIATLYISNDDGLIVYGFPMLPVKLTGNGFTVSQVISVSAASNYSVWIRIVSFGTKIVSLGSHCTLSGDQVTSP
jgi:hypothetical protein